MVIDTSAVIAILLKEQDADAFEAKVVDAGQIYISAVTFLDSGIVIIRRRGIDALAELEEFVKAADIRVMPFTPDQARRTIAGIF